MGYAANSEKYAEFVVTAYNFSANNKNPYY